MKKILKKVQIIFAVILLCYNAIFIPKNNVVRADGGATAVVGGLALGSLNPAVWPFILVGLVACVILGLAYENREELQALGQSVAAELNKLGASIYDFVSGTSVTVNDTLKQAIYNAADNMGETIPGYVEGQVYAGGDIQVSLGVYETSKYLIKPVVGRSIWLGVVDKATRISEGGFFGAKFKVGSDILIPSLTLTMNVEPAHEKANTKNFKLGNNSGYANAIYTYDELGNVTSAKVKLEMSKPDVFSPYVNIWLQNGTGYSSHFRVTSVTIPELGIGVTAPDVPTSKIRENEYDTETRERVADVVFGGSAETITFRPDVNISEVTALNLPTVTDKTYDSGQVRTLEELQAGATSEAGSTATAGAVATPGATTGLLDLSGLWDWLRKIWEAILGLPAALLAGLQALWQALTKILSDILKAITDLGTAIGTYILDGLKAMFGVDSAWFTARVEQLKVKFSEKFPSIQPINYSFVDKENVSDVVVDFPMFGRQTVVSGAMATEFAKVVKVFLRGLFYILLALFFFRKFHKTAEG